MPTTAHGNTAIDEPADHDALVAVTLASPYGGACYIGPVPHAVADALHDLARGLHTVYRQGMDRWEAREVMRQYSLRRMQALITAPAASDFGCWSDAPALRRFLGDGPADASTAIIGLHLLLDDALWTLICVHKHMQIVDLALPRQLGAQYNTRGVCWDCMKDAATAYTTLE